MAVNILSIEVFRVGFVGTEGKQRDGESTDGDGRDVGPVVVR
jgi:hypothetical protein